MNCYFIIRFGDGLLRWFKSILFVFCVVGRLRDLYVLEISFLVIRLCVLLD